MFWTHDTSRFHVCIMASALVQQPWTRSSSEILDHFGVHPTHGLSSADAARHAALYGKNGMSTFSLFFFSSSSSELPEEQPTPLWQLVLEQFKDQLVLILLASAVISFVLALLEDTEDVSLVGAFVEPLVILLILVANAAVGVMQESSAEKAIDVSLVSFLFTLT